MPITETLTAMLPGMLTDPFRVALLVGLVLTQRNTAATTGRLLPLALGVVFVAVILPMTMLQSLPLMPAIGVGILANIILLLPILGLFALWDRRAR